MSSLRSRTCWMRSSLSLRIRARALAQGSPKGCENQALALMPSTVMRCLGSTCTPRPLHVVQDVGSAVQEAWAEQCGAVQQHAAGVVLDCSSALRALR